MYLISSYDNTSAAMCTRYTTPLHVERIKRTNERTNKRANENWSGDDVLAAQVPSPTMHLVPRDDPPMSDLSEVSRRLSPVTRGARCVGLQGTAGLDEVGDGDEKRRWTEALKTSPRLIEASNRVHRDLMNGEPYLAIHWRFEAGGGGTRTRPLVSHSCNLLV